MADNITIGRMTELCGLSAHTLRYYERIGLIQAVARGTDGHRRYSEQDADWISFINRMRSTGMPVADMLEFARLRRLGDSSIPERRALLERHTAKVGVHIDELTACLTVLREKVAFYRKIESSMTNSPLTGKGKSHGNTLRKGARKAAGN